MILAIEIVIILIIVTICDILGLKKGSLAGLRNLPVPIQERVRSLPEYSDKIQGDILSAKQRMMKKLPVIIVVVAAFYGLVYLAGNKNLWLPGTEDLEEWSDRKFYISSIPKGLIAGVFVAVIIGGVMKICL